MSKNKKKRTPFKVNSGYGFSLESGKSKNSNRQVKDGNKLSNTSSNSFHDGVFNANAEQITGDARYYLRITGVLTAVCATVALMLGFVNFLTEDAIAKREEKAKVSAAYEIFPDADEVVAVEGDDSLFVACKNGSVGGYCVSTVTTGYVGDISLMVGITPDRTIKAVKVISMNETAGLGSKTQSPSFLDSFTGKSSPLAVGDNIDAVSGATVSSKAVTAGVDAALNCPVDIDSLSKKLGLTLNTSDNEEEDSESTSDISSNTAESSVPDTTEKTYDTQYDGNVGMPEETHISLDAVGTEQNYRYYSSDNSYTATRQDVGSFLEKETTDTDTAETE